MRNQTFSRYGLAVFLSLCAAFGCADGEQPASSRKPASSSSPMNAPVLMLPVAGSGASPTTQLLPAPPSQPSAAASGAKVEGCAPGVYSGEYDIGLLGSGPITFTLVGGMSPAGSAGCQEFCPELIVSSDGGEFQASLIDFFEGHAKLQGGLDCRTGEFRVDMVAGTYSIGSQSDPNALTLGELTGHFSGHFNAGATPSISGDIMCNAGVDVEGTFMVQRAP